MAISEPAETRSDSLRESGITVERREAGAGLTETSRVRTGFVGSLSTFWRGHHQEIASFLVAIGLLATFLQLRASTSQFDEQMAQNRRATATLLVSDFLNQVGDIVMSGEEEEEARLKSDKVVASRANLLLEELDFIEPRKQILRFLGSSDYGRLIGKKPGDDAPGIDLKNIPLSQSNLAGTDFRNANIFCALLAGSRIDDSDLSESNVHYTDLSSVELGNAKFVGARLDHVDLRESTIVGFPQFLDADIIRSDLTGMRVTDSTVKAVIEIAKGSRAGGAPHKTPSGERTVRGESAALAFFLADVRSLKGSRLDDTVVTALRDELAARGEVDRFESLTGDLATAPITAGTGTDIFTPCRAEEARMEEPEGESILNIFARL